MGRASFLPLQTGVTAGLGIPGGIAPTPLQSLTPKPYLGQVPGRCTDTPRTACLSPSHTQLGTCTPFSSGPLMYFPASPSDLGTTSRCSGSVWVIPLPSPPLLLPRDAGIPGCLRLCVLIPRSPAPSVLHPGAVCTSRIPEPLSRRVVPLPCSPDSRTPLLGATCIFPGRWPSGIPKWEFGACLYPWTVCSHPDCPPFLLSLVPLGIPTQS